MKQTKEQKESHVRRSPYEPDYADPDNPPRHSRGNPKSERVAVKKAAPKKKAAKKKSA